MIVLCCLGGCIRHFFLILLALEAIPTRAGSFDFALSSGSMVQPGSQYHLTARGGFLGYGNDNRSFLTRLGYIERPIFISRGFREGEWIRFVSLGTSLAKWDSIHLIALLGWGAASGLIENEATGERRAYTIEGLSAEAELRFDFHPIFAAFSHQTFTGLAGEEQTDAYVAWPFNMFLAHIGVYL